MDAARSGEAGLDTPVEDCHPPEGKPHGMRRTEEDVGSNNEILEIYIRLIKAVLRCYPKT